MLYYAFFRKNFGAYWKSQTPHSARRPKGLHSKPPPDPSTYSAAASGSSCPPTPELKVLNKSRKDGKPRVVNINVDNRRDDMLRVGVWNKLDDPSKYQQRHILIASLCRAAPNRACQMCSYILQHSCSYKHTSIVHCANCCNDVKLNTQNL